MKLTVVTGPPAAGKTTYVREHAQLGDIVVDFDDLAVALGSPGKHEHPDDIREVATAARKAAVDVVLDGGVGVTAWVVHTAPNDEQVAAYEAAGASFVTVDPGQDIVLSQAQQDDRPEWTAQAIRDWYNRKAGGRVTVKTMGVARAALKVKLAGPDDGLGEGVFEGYASVFGNVDSYGDIVEPGAFKDTLGEWRAKGDPIPLLWGHDLYDPFSNIGSIDPAEAVEDDKGLLVKGTLDLTNPTAAQVYKLIKGRRVSDMSFAYRVLEESKSADGNHLLKLDLSEVSIVPVGANSETDILAVKGTLAETAIRAGRALATAGHVKAGRVLSKANENKLQEAVDAIQAAADSIESVLATVVSDSGNIKPGDGEPAAAVDAEGKASDKPDVKDTSIEDPSAEAPGQGATDSEELKAKSSVELEAAETLFYGGMFTGKDVQ